MANMHVAPDHRKQGLYRTRDPYLGECARVHIAAGDAWPYLIRDLYEALHFKPAFDELPVRSDA